MKGTKWIIPIGIASIMTVSTLGCTTTTKDQSMRNRNYPQPTRVQNVVPPAPVTPVPPAPTTPVPPTTRPAPAHPAMEYRTADRVADELVKMKGVKSATVVIHRETAYVGATVDPTVVKTRSEERKLKQSMLEKVKRLERDVKSVYVSTAPSFVGELKKISDDIRSGRVVSDINKRMNNLVSKTFPGRP